MKNLKIFLSLLACLAVLFFSMFFASRIQSDSGNIEVSDVTYTNASGLKIRAKLLKPKAAAAENKMPGVVHMHGYPSSREKGDPVSIELARRGIVVLNIDVLGRGNSDPVRSLGGPGFDESYGANASLRYLRALPYVNTGSIGLVGHSLGGKFAYETALSDPQVRAVVIMGNGYDERATRTNPKNMLMIFGERDEYRKRMTRTKDFRAEWLESEATKKAFPAGKVAFEKTYGSFREGTARAIHIPSCAHQMESHHEPAVARSVEWFRDSLKPDPAYWLESGDQVWWGKEWLTLLGLVSCFLSLIPLSMLLLKLNFFSGIIKKVHRTYACKGAPYIKSALVNGVLVWLYLPLILVLFLTTIHLVKIDKVFPMMTTNAVTWWFLVTNTIGFLLFRRWYRKNKLSSGLTLAELGISHSEEGFKLEGKAIVRTIILGIVLLLFVYTAQSFLEHLFLVSFHFIFDWANDLTPYRLKCFFLYLPFLLTAFIFNGIFMHGRMRRPCRGSWLKSYSHSTLYNVLLMVIPILLFLCVQYVPIFFFDRIPLAGPGGIFVFLIINLFHIIGVLILIIPLSTWFYQKTGTIYLGALMNALLVAWMFASTQVIAPMPV